MRKWIFAVVAVVTLNLANVVHAQTSSGAHDGAAAAPGGAQVYSETGKTALEKLLAAISACLVAQPSVSQAPAPTLSALKPR